MESIGETSSIKQNTAGNRQRKPIAIRFFSFLVNPTQAPIEDSTTEARINKLLKNAWDFIRLFALQYGLAIGLGILATVVLSIVKYDQNDHDLNKLINEGDVLFLFLYASLIAPLLEELLFRSLLKLSYLRIAISFSLFALFAISSIKEYFPHAFDFFPKELFVRNELLLLPIYIGSAVLLVIVTYLILRVLIPKAKIQKGYNPLFFRFLYYGTSLVFGLMHIMNYQNLGSIWPLTIILVAPQITIGLFLGFMRVKYGLPWSIANHALHNFISTLPIMIVSISSGNVSMFFKKLEDPNFMAENLTVTEAIGLAGISCFMILGFFLVLALSLQMFIEALIYLLDKKKDAQKYQTATIQQ